jgi:hypothetical protein
MGVDHGGADVLVTEQFLRPYGCPANVVSHFEQVGGEAVSEGVAARPLGPLQGADGGGDGPGQDAFQNVVSAAAATLRVGAETLRREHELPAQRPLDTRILDVEGVGHRHPAEAAAEVALVEGGTGAQLFFQRRPQTAGDGTMRSLSPLPARTVMRPRSTSTSLTRRPQHSMTRMPVP